MPQDQPDHEAPEPKERSRVLKPVPQRRLTPPQAPTTPTLGPPPPAGTRVPLPVIAFALVFGVLAVAITSLFLPAGRPGATTPVPTQRVDSTAPADTGLDVRWQGGRKDGDDCIGTFEVTRGGGTRAEFVAFVMDSTGAVMAGDSSRVDAAVPGLRVALRFRQVRCEKIDDWQLQVTTPKSRPN